VPCTVRLVPITKPPVSFHDFADYERLVEAAKRKGWRTHLIVLMGGEAGLRCGEMVALEWRDVDLTKRQLCVRQSDWRGQLTAPKNSRIRYLPMTQRLVSTLKEYRHLRSLRVLCKDNGEPLTRQSAWSRVRRAARAAKVPTGVHILRHTFCRIWQCMERPGAGSRAGRPRRTRHDAALHSPESDRVGFSDSSVGVCHGALRLWRRRGDGSSGR
jgi:integrase